MGIFMQLIPLILGTVTAGFVVDINRREYREAKKWLREHTFDTDPIWWKGYCNRIKDEHKVCYYVGYPGRTISLINYHKG